MWTTTKQKQEHEEDKRPSFRRSLFYHSHLVSSPVTNSLYSLVVKDVCAGLYYYIFIHTVYFYCFVFFFKCLFSTFVITKNTTFKQMHKKQLHNDCS